MGRIFIAVLLIISSNVIAQNFNGYIFYKYTYLDSAGQDITKSKTQEKGYSLEQHYFINDSNYLALDENGILIQLYNSYDNNYYFSMDGKVSSVNANIEFPPSPKIESNKEKVNVLNYRCKSRIFITELTKTTYFYSKKIAIDPKNFENHRFGNWSKYLSVSKGALPLRIVSAYEDYIQILEAVKVEEKEVPDEKFDISTYLE